MKHCFTCKSDKEEVAFGVRKASPDGLSPKCKDCQKEYDKKRLRCPKRMKARLDYQKTDAGKLAHNKAARRWVETNTVKRATHIIVGNALRSGSIVKLPCEICGCSKSNGHHDDYAYPLSVRWLCDDHHKEWHRVNGEGKNAN